MNKTTFQDATIDNIAAILLMMENFYNIDGYGFNESACQKNLQLFLTDETLGKFWLIYVDGQLAGYAIITFGFSFEYNGRDAFLDELFIEKKHRRKGLGKETMDFLISYAKSRSINALHLEVENHNSKANDLYHKKGFKNNGRLLLTKILKQ